jgi:tRNA(Ile)-lysidine synthase
MPPRRGPYRRPLLELSRAQLREACAAQGLQPWDDPHNADPAYARARVRHMVLPALEDALGPGVANALARTAAQLRADGEALDALADAQTQLLRAADGSLDVAGLARLPEAIRTRVLRATALAAGCPGGSLATSHIAALEALVTRWRGQRWSDLPGGIRASRQCGRLLFSAATSAGAGAQRGKNAEGVGGRERRGR